MKIGAKCSYSQRVLGGAGGGAIGGTVGYFAGKAFCKPTQDTAEQVFSPWVGKSCDVFDLRIAVPMLAGVVVGSVVGHKVACPRTSLFSLPWSG